MKTSLDQRILDKIPNKQLASYQIIEAVGAGGMAAVLRALDLDLNRSIALKILPPEMAEDPDHLERFRQEARAAAKLDHENIARVYAIGEDQGLNYIAFEFVEGENLRHRMDRSGGRLAVAEAVPLILQVAAGLSHAASRGVVHRDIKPSNILITPENKAKIVDMGLARNADGRPADGGITQSGVTLGTFDYISPEQAIDPRRADIRSDIYSLGCTFYHALTGRSPAPEGTAARKLRFHQSEEPADPRLFNPIISTELTAVLARMMAKDPLRRYQHPDQLIQHLLTLTEREKIPLSSTKVEALPRDLSFREPLIPEPPRLSKAMIAVAAGLMVAVLAWLTGGFRDGRAPLNDSPFWSAEGPKRAVASDQETYPSTAAPQANDGLPPIAAGATDLRRLLAQGASAIRLQPGEIYDLSRGAEVVFKGTSLVLDGGDGVQPAVVILKADPADDAVAPLQFPGPMRELRFRGIRFEWTVGDGTARSAISVARTDRFEADRCAFVESNPGLGTETRMARFAFLDLKCESNPSLVFNRCYFGPGDYGVRWTGQATVDAAECAFAPMQAVFAEEGKPGDGVSLVHLARCSAMLDGGAVVQAADRVPCQMTILNSIFARADEAADAVGTVFRQVGSLAPETRYSPPMDAVAGKARNVYHRVPPAMIGGQARSFAECEAERFPVQDATALSFAFPWQAAKPMEKLRDARSAFQLSLKPAGLRVPGDPDAAPVGIGHVLGTQIYDLPVRKPDDPRKAAQRVVQPDWPRGEALPDGTYRYIRDAVEDAQPGDEILLRWSGPRLVRPVEFEKTDLQLTIRPEEGSRPVLVLTGRSRNQAIFRMPGGQLTLEGLEFRIGRDAAAPEATRSVVSMLGGGTCVIRDCVATLQDQDGLSVIQLEDPRDEMMMNAAADKWPLPKVTIEKTFARGKGNLFSVRSSRSFELDVKESLAALEGSLLDMDPTTMDVANVLPAQVRLHHSTFYLTGAVFDLQAAARKPEQKGIGLVPLHAVALSSLFVPAATPPACFIRFDRVETEAQARVLFDWRGSKDNRYGYEGPNLNLMERIVENPESPPAAVDVDRWLELWREQGRPFGPVKFTGPLPETGKPLSGVNPADFAAKVEETDGAGAKVEALPVPYILEKNP